MNYRLLGAILAALSLGGCSSTKKPRDYVPESVSGLTIVEVKPAAVTDWMEAVGTVRARQTSVVSSQVPATIVQMHVHEGDRVRRGQVLVTLDDAQFHASQDAARASLAAARQGASAAASELGLATTTLRRYQDLLDKKSVSPQEFDEVKARRQMAQARRERANADIKEAEAVGRQAQIVLARATLTAPFDGLITQKQADAGTFAAPGMPLLTLENTRQFNLEVSVNEADLHFVKAGQSTVVAIESLGKDTLPGKITQIVPAADPSSRSFIVKIELPNNPYMHSGIYGRARFARGQRQSIVIPRTAAVERGQLQVVYAVGPDQLLNLRLVTLGQIQEQGVEVLTGLTTGDRVVVAPGDRELGGKRVEARR